MHQLNVEKPDFDSKRPLSWHLAHGIYARMKLGKIIIVTDKPNSLLSATRKKWFRLLRQLQRERSSVLSGVRADQLLRDANLMQKLTFTAKPPDDLLEADITFATADDFIKSFPVCRTAYITGLVPKEKRRMLTSWMPQQSVVIIYERDC